MTILGRDSAEARSSVGRRSHAHISLADGVVGIGMVLWRLCDPDIAAHGVALWLNAKRNSLIQELSQLLVLDAWLFHRIAYLGTLGLLRLVDRAEFHKRKGVVAAIYHAG